MKKNISLLIIFAMLFSLLPIHALAYEIGSVTLSATEPVVGKTPDYNVTCIDPNNQNLYRIDTAENKNGAVNGVKWYNNTDEKIMSANDKFEEGKKYTLSVRVEPNSGHKFALNTSVGTHTAVSGYINGKSAKVALASDTLLELYVQTSFVIPAKISSVGITNISAPVSGNKPEYSATISGDGYSLTKESLGNFKNGIYWFDTTEQKLVNENEAFIEGHQYRVFLCLSTDNNDFEFATDANGNPKITASVNGNSAKVITYQSKPAKQLINVYHDFPACEKPQVSSVIIENIPTPQAGKAPEYTADIISDGFVLASVNNTFTKNGICWTHKTKGFDLTPSGFFYSGVTYVATLRLDVKPGYTLKQPITATVNGKAATATVSGGQVIVKYEVKCPDYKISQVDITGVSVPAIGNSPSKDMQSAEPNLYVVKSVSWYVDNEVMSESDKFIAGKNYDLVVYVDPKQEGWDYTAYFADKVAVTVNGNKVSEKKVERLGNSVKFTYTFTASASSKIGTVDIIGIDVPVAGKLPDYTADTANSNTYMVDTSITNKTTSNGVTWRNVTTGNAMIAGVEKFEKGNVYEVMVTATPYKGYTFVTKSDGTPAVSGTINGKTATDIMGRSDVEAIIVYKFPVTEDSTEKDDSPATENQGDKQNGTATDPGTTTGSDTATGTGSDNNTVKKSFIDVAKDAYYYEPVMWAAENGITGGTSANTFSPNASCTRAQVVTFLHRMVASPEPAAIDMPFVDVKATSYYFKPVKWAFASNITGGTSATTFSPDNNCTRAQVVTFLWRCAGKPKASGSKNPFVDVKAGSYYYDAVLWAVEKGVTGGTSATTFSPDANCTRAQVVTFLYRFINGQ